MGKNRRNVLFVEPFRVSFEEIIDHIKDSTGEHGLSRFILLAMQSFECNDTFEKTKKAVMKVE